MLVTLVYPVSLNSWVICCVPNKLDASSCMGRPSWTWSHDCCTIMSDWKRNSFLNTSYSRKLFVTSPIPPGSCTRCLFGWCLCRADGVIASRYSDSAGSGRGVCFEAVWRPEYCGLLLRRGSCERRRLSCGLRDGGDAGRPCALHLPKQWLRNQARTPRVPSQA